MANFDDILASARLPEDSVPLCLRGDLTRRHEELERELDDAREADRGDSLAAGGQARKVAEEIDALQKEMQDHTHAFGFRALNRRAYRNLVEQHPARDDNAEDAVFGADTRTFPHALISACAIDPVMSEAQVEALCEVLTDGQTLELFGCALALNRVSVNVPKSAAASAILALRAPRSQPPEPGGSAAGGSSAGSLAG